MAKLIKLSETSAVRISIVRIKSNGNKGPKMLSVRKMYCTKKAPDKWLPTKQGITLSFDICAKIIKGMIAVYKDPDQKVEVILGRGEE